MQRSQSFNEIQSIKFKMSWCFWSVKNIKAFSFIYKIKLKAFIIYTPEP